MSRIRLGSILAAAGILIVTGGCAESPSAPAHPGAGLQLLRAPQEASFSRSGGESSSTVIGPEGGVIETSAGRLTFPAGALSQPTEIGMRADGQYQGVRLSPHGLQFPAHAQPVLELRATGAGAHQGLTVVYVDDANQVLEVLSTSRRGSVLTVGLEHFSGYIIATTRTEG